MPVEIAGALGWDPREVIEVADDVNRAVVLTFDGLNAEGVSLGESVASNDLTPELETRRERARAATSSTPWPRCRSACAR